MSNSKTQFQFNTRRDFIYKTTLAFSSVVAGLKAAEVASPSRSIIAFSKPFQHLGPNDTAAFVENIGWSGIECPVRAKGQINPQHVADDLPRFIEAFKRRSLSIPILVTDITDIHQPYAVDVLRAASKYGVKIIRLGPTRYTSNKSIDEQVSEISKRLKDIGDACAELNIKAGVENHEGATMFAAPIWDAYNAIKAAQSKALGFCFDIGHATIEGGMSWPIQARIVEPYLLSLYIKDFIWTKVPSGWKPKWCNLGDGMVDKNYIKHLLKLGYNGPLCQHHEYNLGDNESMVRHMRRDLNVLRDWLT
jgi:sugar phosphate isomerase/epimerase